MDVGRVYAGQPGAAAVEQHRDAPRTAATEHEIASLAETTSTAPHAAIDAIERGQATHPPELVRPPPARSTAELYGKLAPSYDEHTAERQWSAPQALALALEAVQPPASHLRVLDVGVGTGQASLPYLAVRATVTGLDIAPEMLSEAKRKHPGFHHLGTYDINTPLARAGIRPASQDLIVSSGTLHFAKDLEATLGDLAQALTSGGVLAFTYVPPQGRDFSAHTTPVEPERVDAALGRLGFSMQTHDRFVAYFEGGPGKDPVYYQRCVATKAGAAAVLPNGLELDRTSCVDRGRIARLAATPMREGPAHLDIVADLDPRLVQQQLELRDAYRALRDGKQSPTDLEAHHLPLPTVVAETATRGKAGCDVLVVLAHPDDESLYAGGTLRALADAGYEVRVVTPTFGEAGRSNLSLAQPSTQALAATRTNELERALDVLGAKNAGGLYLADFGKYQDTTKQVPHTAATSLVAWAQGPAGQDPAELIANAIQRHRPRVVLSFDATRDPNYSLHGHHLATGAATAVAFHLAGSPGRAARPQVPWTPERHFVLAPSATESTRTVEVTFPANTKLAAVQAHASQSYSIARFEELARREPQRAGREHWHLLQGRTQAPASSKGIEALIGAPARAAETRASAHDTVETLPIAASALRKAQLAGDARATAFYTCDSLATGHAKRSTRRYPRAELVTLLDRQNRARGADDAALANIARLSRHDTMAVVTGQQVGVLGGPAYTLYKAVGAIAEAARLTEQGLPAVPVFWMASYDHDQREAATVHLVNGQDAPTTHLLPCEHEQAPVGPQRLGPAITDVLADLEQQVAGSPHAAQVMELARRAYRPEATYAEAFGQLLTDLMSRLGLIVLDPMDPAFAALARPVIERDLFGTESSASIIATTTAALEKAVHALPGGESFHAQIEQRDLPPKNPKRRARKPEPHGALTSVMFTDANGQRVAMRKVAGGFELQGEPEFLTDAEARELLQSSPERFTAKALLRPVVEASVLPTLEYVGGPAEVAYFAQAGGLFDRAQVPRTHVVQRPGFTVLGAHDHLALTASGTLSLAKLVSAEKPLALIGDALANDQVTRAYDVLETTLTRTSDSVRVALAARDWAGATAGMRRLRSEVGHALAEARSAAQAQGLERCVKGLTHATGELDRLASDLERGLERAATDKAYAPPVGRVGAIVALVPGLRAQLAKTARKSQPDAGAALHRLLPHGKLQERTLTVTQLLAEHGVGLVDTLRAQAKVDPVAHPVLVSAKAADT